MSNRCRSVDNGTVSYLAFDLRLLNVGGGIKSTSASLLVGLIDNVAIYVLH